MGFMRRSSAIVLGLIIGIAGFMLYHKQTTLPLADVMTTQIDAPAGDMTYQLYTDHLVISNSSTTIIGTLKFSISYDTSSIKFLIDKIISPYDYSFDSGRNGTMTVFIDGTIEPGEVVTIPLEWESTNMSIASPILINGDATSSLTLTRIE